MVSNLALLSDVFNHVKGGGKVDVICTDFDRAFGRVDHDILLLKLQALGIHNDLVPSVHSYL